MPHQLKYRTLHQDSPETIVYFRCYELVSAQYIEMVAWFGWLRSLEMFIFQVENINLVPTVDLVVYGISTKPGNILIRLLLLSNLSCNKRAGVVIAWNTTSDIFRGSWLSSLLDLW